jgi:DNA-binding response OmpR family regulator
MQTSPAASNRILIVEPDAATRELLADVVRNAGCEAVPVDTGERALARTRAERGGFAGLFAEVDLPGLVDGWIVADEFRSTNPSSPIVLASDEPSDEVAAEGTTAAVVRRPKAPVDVLAVVRGLIRRCQIGISSVGLNEPPCLPA